MKRFLPIALLACSLNVNAQTRDAIDIAVPWISTGPNTLRLTGGFSNGAGSYLALTDSIENLMGLDETAHVRAEVGVRLRRIEIGFRKRAPTRRRLEFGIDASGQSFRYNQLVESSILSFNRNIGVFSRLNEIYPDDPINYVRSSYGARFFAETLMVCLAGKIAATEVEPLALGIVAWHKEMAPAGDTSIVFRDSAFADDVARTNLTPIPRQHGLGNVRSL